MASWGTLKNIFESPLPDPRPSWTQLLPETSFDMFGDICHHIMPVPSPSHPPPPPPILLPSCPKPRLNKSSSWNCTLSDTNNNAFAIYGELCYKTEPKPSSSSPKKSENLDLSTDGDADDQANDCERKVIYTRSYSDVRSRCDNVGSFPPPITSIGRRGKPRVYFKSYRQDGRFVLREIMIPSQRLLHSRREDGRLQMRVISPVGENASRLVMKGETENAEEGRRCESTI